MDVGRAFMKREKNKVGARSLQNISANAKKATFVILKTTQAHLLKRKDLVL